MEVIRDREAEQGIFFSFFHAVPKVLGGVYLYGVTVHEKYTPTYVVEELY